MAACLLCLSAKLFIRPISAKDKKEFSPRCQGASNSPNSSNQHELTEARVELPLCHQYTAAESSTDLALGH
ncbi:hypothetical protein BDV28DRAFT_151266 [Aspergillus coremiiformis]|uniref:Uncharacterized protein n=1 Tax=Aspergillus coremiiformis TaxID=138285 RepID=A0A5N6YYR9_9EURO|nr:hypothetical protein BDV28DRAFT_151266 [Aspergillus coremiiformis]